MNLIEPRPYADPDVAARKIVELANAIETIQDGRIYIEEINGPFLYQLKGTPAEYKAGLDRAISMRAVLSYASLKPARTCLRSLERWQQQP
jgi:hypothetical protein